MTLQRNKDYRQSIPDYARSFVEEINKKRVERGDLPLSDEALNNVLDKLAEIRNKS